MSLLRYVRSGGPDPGEDEWLEVDDDGTFTLERHVARGRIGAFAGRVDDGVRSELAALVDGLASAGDEERPTTTPDRPVIEILRTPAASARATFDDSELPEGWERLRERSRELVDRLTDQPVCGLELEVSPDATTVTLTVLGPDDLEVREGEAEVEVTVFDPDDEWVGSTRVTLDWPGAGGEPCRLRAGWTTTASLDHGLDFSRDGSLSAALSLEVSLPKSGWAPARVSAVAGTGWD